jgi:hypothetical protein
MNVLHPDKLDMVIKSFIQGDGIRKASREVGIAKNTVSKYYRMFVKINNGIDPSCKCGLPVTHQGWCKERYKKSDARKLFMSKWNKRTRRKDEGIICC